MKKLRLVLLLVMAGAGASAQSLQWARSMGGAGVDAGITNAVDASGNVYTAGSFQGTADFDPGAGVYSIPSNGSNDVFVSKLDAQGNFLWALNIGNSNSDIQTGMALDGSGNVYLTGYFTGTVDFDPGPNVFNLVGTGPFDIFIMKLDPSGTLVWAVRIGGSATIQSSALAVDAQGDVYTTGYFIAPMDFDPGPGVFNMQPLAVDVFISKLDNNGNFVWARRLGGNATDRAFAISVDCVGNVYTVGSFSSPNADFDPGPGVFTMSTANFVTNGFISKLSPAGNFLWAGALSGSGVSQVSGITFDNSCNPIVTGGYSGQIDFDPGPGLNPAFSINNTVDAFVSKLDSTGTVIWTTYAGGTGTDVAICSAVDINGNIFTTGRFDATADFDPSPNSFDLTPNGGDDVFVYGLSPAGNLISAISFGDTGADYSYRICTDAGGGIYLAGAYTGAPFIDPVTSLTSMGSFDVFILKYLNCTTILTGNPADATTGLQSTAQFTVGSGTAGNSYQWQLNSGAGFADLADGGQYAGATTPTLTVSGTLLSQNANQFRCRISNGTCSVTSTAGNLAIYDNTGIDEGQLEAFTVYPNPASQLVHIQAGAARIGAGYSMIDQTGRLVLSGKLTASETSVDIGTLAPGLYLLQLQGNRTPLKLVVK